MFKKSLLLFLIGQAPVCKVNRHDLPYGALPTLPVEASTTGGKVRAQAWFDIDDTLTESKDPFYTWEAAAAAGYNPKALILELLCAHTEPGYLLAAGIVDGSGKMTKAFERFIFSFWHFANPDQQALTNSEWPAYLRDIASRADLFYLSSSDAAFLSDRYKQFQRWGLPTDAVTGTHQILGEVRDSAGTQVIARHLNLLHSTAGYGISSSTENDKSLVLRYARAGADIIVVDDQLVHLNAIEAALTTSPTQFNSLTLIHVQNRKTLIDGCSFIYNPPGSPYPVQSAAWDDPAKQTAFISAYKAKLQDMMMRGLRRWIAEQAKHQPIMMTQTVTQTVTHIRTGAIDPQTLEQLYRASITPNARHSITTSSTSSGQSLPHDVITGLIQAQPAPISSVLDTAAHLAIQAQPAPTLSILDTSATTPPGSDAGTLEGAAVQSITPPGSDAGTLEGAAVQSITPPGSDAGTSVAKADALVMQVRSDTDAAGRSPDTDQAMSDVSIVNEQANS